MLTILHNIVPVFAIMVLGHILGRRRFVSGEFFESADRLVYFILFPVLLFWKIGGAGAAAGFNWPLNAAVLIAIFMAYIVSLVYARTSGMNPFLVGSFSQCSFRFNSYVGFAVVLAAMGEEGVLDFGVIISLAIPFINVLAVSTLIWYSRQDYSPTEKLRFLVKAMIANPLILACLAGLAYSTLDTPFPLFFENTFSLLAVATLPLALLSVGNALTLEKLKGYLPPTLAACLVKLVVLPGLGYILLTLFGVSGRPFQAAMIFFALPTATSTFILSSQLNSDTNLASAGIVLSTLLSFFSLSLVLLI